MADEWSNTMPPDLDTIETLARAALTALPIPFAAAAQGVVLRVEDLADDAMLDDLGMDDPFSLTGLYDGIPLTEKSVMDQPTGPDVIWLFRRAILDEWVSRGDVTLADLVTHVVVHELAHHMGWSDADIARIDRWWE
ncbi:neutral zinc metallopeptidase [Meridianimarinicoccus roseus]|uniref:Neutral zinc metallopeptidase n=1 Tax=Meridianimarinicoccus roseus TaxID=2072018 RepID=A0A2V2LC43_9RHOB|nr:metallopeptidase family protein [Meridianimarinicoccus roseus]PWR00837.1 neutral zinc metallopeptidase [Meridianimarinicoccus roseus]